MSGVIFLLYGECPECGAMCQPDYVGEVTTEEWVECEDCGIQWTLYHDDPNDKYDETEPGRKYRIGEIEPI